MQLRRRFRTHKLFIFFRRVDLAMSVCPETLRATPTLSVLAEYHAHSDSHKPPKTVAPSSVDCHAYSNFHKPPKTVTPKVLMLDRF